MPDPLIIGMVADHCCIRVYKEARVLMDQGHKVHLFTRQLKFGAEHYCTVQWYSGPPQLHRAIRSQPQIQILHVHNEPDWLAEEVLKARFPTQAVIWDIHDFESARWVSSPIQEQRILRSVDGVVHVSSAMAAFAHEIYGERHPPTAVLPCHVPAAWYVDPVPEADLLGDCVYEGGLDTPFKAEPQPHGAVGHAVSMRDYGLLFSGLVRAGRGVTAFQSNVGPDTTAYAALGVTIRPQVNYTDLMPTLARYRWGIVGSSYASLLMDHAMPNKLFEYLAAGIPVIVYEANAAAAFVEHHGIGVVIRPTTREHRTLSVQHATEIPHLAAQVRALCTEDRWRACRANVLAKRHEWTMERQIPALTDLYAYVRQRQQGGNGHARVGDAADRPQPAAAGDGARTAAHV